MFCLNSVMLENSRNGVSKIVTYNRFQILNTMNKSYKMLKISNEICMWIEE